MPEKIKAGARIERDEVGWSGKASDKMTFEQRASDGSEGVSPADI